MMNVQHYSPRRKTHVTQKQHCVQLAICFVATLVFMVILAVASYVWGQEHPFPFKTLEDITKGTPAWEHESPPEPSVCPGGALTVFKYRLTSGADSLWIVYTDGALFAAAYFPPTPVPVFPIVIVEGRIVDGKVVVDLIEDFNPAKHRPCNKWRTGA